MAGGGRIADCGCKGIRTCLLCESAKRQLTEEPPKTKAFIYIPTKGRAQGVKNSDTAGWWFPYPGVCLIEDFVTEDEEKEMVHTMDQEEWRLSQSGRRKQDFGPKVNFKKQKIKVDSFTGLPNFSKVLWERMKTHTVLEGFLPVEQCNLDYNSDRGSAIDPHYDDSWLWGERLVSLNLLSDTVLTMTIPCTEVEVAICLPRRSLVVLYGEARYSWKHAIYRQHIKQRRVCSTFRELSAEFMAGGVQEKLGQMLLEIALAFQGKSV
ncbi:PREDICTED: alpha-ketoglutarate-dependent dioxygenase alkB homolog 4 [Nanorana parkeri]|uniref:alpha-ketoglutarate-dependent dioxygenase alkB homolog 4 n=1 Tax=Nanorana parkeri TaxID=125878 RepID=UPI000853F631|nr:PREDICTED: alpha-ketoglutarate-dependent dioxygenase alkB homolog 4 [Nanorana parkeri]